MQSRLGDDTPYHLIRIGEEPDSTWKVMEVALSPTVRKYYSASPIVLHIDSLDERSALDGELMESYAGDSLWVQPSEKSMEASVLSNYCQIDEQQKLYISVLGKWSEEEYVAHVEQRRQRLEEEESQRILNWIDKSGADSVPAYDQVFLMEFDSTGRSGLQVACDSVVVVHYKGWFLDGKEFDQSEEKGFPYRVCDNGQLLKGIAMAVGWMHLGDKLKIILPSQLAFGAKGSANGVVPPFTPVIYEIQISHQ